MGTYALGIYGKCLPSSPPLPPVWSQWFCGVCVCVCVFWMNLKYIRLKNWEKNPRVSLEWNECASTFDRQKCSNVRYGLHQNITRKKMNEMAEPFFKWNTWRMFCLLTTLCLTSKNRYEKQKNIAPVFLWCDCCRPIPIWIGRQSKKTKSQYERNATHGAFNLHSFAKDLKLRNHLSALLYFLLSTAAATAACFSLIFVIKLVCNAFQTINPLISSQ